MPPPPPPLQPPSPGERAEPPVAAPGVLPVPAAVAPAPADANAAATAESAASPAPPAAAPVATPAAQAAPTAAAPSGAAAPATTDAVAAPPRRRRPQVWLLLPVLGIVLLAWWASLRRARRLGQQAEQLAREQRFLKSAHSHLQRKSEQLQYLSMHDPLTGTLNRHAFAAELRVRIDHLAKYNQPLCLIMFDLDHFKQINDRHGHQAGDAALALVVGVVREHLVSDDLFGRFGGDEFMIACSGQDVVQAAALADALRTAVAARAPQAQPPIPDLTLSLGVAQADPQRGYDADALFARSDAALYAAKRRGRNRVVAEARDEALPMPDAVRRHL